MTATLTPALALAYLRELSTDVRAAIVLDAAGERLAGDDELAAAARWLLGAGSAAAIREQPAAEGTLLALRARDGCAIAVIAGDRALLGLLRHDLERTLEALCAGPA
jgi:hypothetical protein